MALRNVNGYIVTHMTDCRNLVCMELCPFLHLWSVGCFPVQDCGSFEETSLKGTQRLYSIMHDTAKKAALGGRCEASGKWSPELGWVKMLKRRLLQ